MEITETGAYSMALFPADNGIGGALVKGEGSIPGEIGTLVYLNAGKDLNTVLNKIQDAGGHIILEKTLISEESGYFALFIDTEGNKLALHSKKLNIYEPKKKPLAHLITVLDSSGSIIGMNLNMNVKIF